MNSVRYQIFQDFLQVVLMGMVAGVLFSMAVTGVVFLLSGSPAEEAATPVAVTSPAAQLPTSK